MADSTLDSDSALVEEAPPAKEPEPEEEEEVDPNDLDPEVSVSFEEMELIRNTIRTSRSGRKITAKRYHAVEGR